MTSAGHHENAQASATPDEHAQHDPQGILHDLQSRCASTGSPSQVSSFTIASVPPTNTNASAHTGASSPPPTSSAHDAGSPTHTIRPSSFPSALPNAENSTDRTIQSMRSSFDASPAYSTGSLPPPHALPSDSQPILLQTSSLHDASRRSLPTPLRDTILHGPQTQPITLPPAPAHPALALMRSNSSRSVPRRPLSAPGISTTVRAATYPGEVRTVESRNGNGRNYAPGNGSNVGSGNAHVQRASYASTRSTNTEKHHILLDEDAPTSPSGRVLRLDDSELPHQYMCPEQHHGVRAGQYGYGEKNCHKCCRDSLQYPESIYNTAQGVMGAGVNMLGQLGTAFGQYNPRRMSFGMTNGGGGWGGPPTLGGPGGLYGLGGPGITGNDAFLNAYTDIGIPRLPRTAHERLAPTLDIVKEELARASRKAKVTGLVVSIAIGMQVLVSALITALAAVGSSRRSQIMTSVLGGLGTLVASVLARARGSNEPELSTARVKDLQRFERACMAFLEDSGGESGWEGHPHYMASSNSEKNRHMEATGYANGDEEKEKKEGRGGMGMARGWDGGMRAYELDERIRRLRTELEHLLGNGNGERKLSQV